MLEQVKAIAGFQPQDDGLGEYPLDEPQTRQIAIILGFRPERRDLITPSEPYDPPEDTGFQVQTISANDELQGG